MAAVAVPVPDRFGAPRAAARDLAGHPSGTAGGPPAAGTATGAMAAQPPHTESGTMRAECRKTSRKYVVLTKRDRPCGAAPRRKPPLPGPLGGQAVPSRHSWGVRAVVSRLTGKHATMGS